MSSYNHILKVKLSTHRGKQTQKSKEVIDYTVSQYACDTNAVTAGIKCFSDVWIGGIKNRMNKLQTIYYSLSFQWGDTGWRCISAANFVTLQDEVTKAESYIETQVEFIRQNWQAVVADSQSLMGKLFDPNIFSDPYRITGNIGIKLSAEAMPQDDLEKMEANFGPLAKEIIAQQTSESMAAVKEVENQLLNRIAGLLSGLSDKTTEPEQKGKKYKVILEKLDELCDDKKFNISGNPAITAIQAKVKDAVQTFDGDAIRDSDFVRNEVTRCSNGLIADLAGLQL